MTQSQELVAIETIKAIDLFQPGGADRILDEIKSRVNSIVLDVSTEKGRAEIRSMAAKIAKSKTALDGMGKELKSEWKAKCDGIDAERRKIWDELESLQHSVRQPLTDFENKEKQRVADHEKALEDLAALQNFCHADALGNLSTSQQVIEAREKSRQLHLSRDWEEFVDRAGVQQMKNEKAFETSINTKIEQEAEKAELDRLRKAEEERKQKERDEQIAREAADKATREAEEKAAKEKADLEARAKKAEEDAERAAQAERDRIEAEKKREAEATAKREADIEHRRTINKDAVVDLSVSVPDLEMGFCQKVIKAIAKGQIPNVKINY